MKRTENINLGGYAFIIEEDACKELSEYIDKIKDSLADDAEEVTADIEVRIAEILSEKTGSTNVVTLPMIEEVRKRIGNPSEISEDNEDKPKDPKQEKIKKRLFRDVENRFLGGVCAGIGAYFGIDPVIIRILFIILAVLGLFTRMESFITIALLGYSALWVAMPAARTVEEKCSMKGKPMRLESFVSSKADIRQEINELATSEGSRKVARVFSCIFGIIMIIAGLSNLLGCFVIPIVPQIFDKYIDLGKFVYGNELAMASRIIMDPYFWWFVTAFVVLFSVWLLLCGTILCFDFKAPKWKPGLVLFIAWIFSILALAAWVVKIVADMIPMII